MSNNPGEFKPAPRKWLQSANKEDLRSYISLLESVITHFQEKIDLLKEGS